MPALNLTAAQATLVTNCATSLENAFFSGVTNVGAGFLPALTGYAVDATIGGGVASKAAANRTLIKQNFQSVIASLIATLGIQGGSTWNTIATDIATQQAALTSLQTVVANNAFAVQSTYGTGGYIPGMIWYASDDNATKPKAGIFSQFAAAGSSLIFGTTNAYATGVNNSAIVINPAGQVGIGTTPTAFTLELPDPPGGSDTVARIGTTMPLFLRSNYPTVGFNLYYAASGYKYGANGRAAQIQFEVPTGDLVIYNAPVNVGGPGFAASPVETFRVQNGGNVTAPNYPSASAVLGSNYTIPGAGWNCLPLATVDYDASSMITGLGTTGLRFTVPTGKGGRYLITFTVQIENATSACDFLVSAWGNGADFQRLGRQSVALNGYIQVGGSMIMNLNAGDYIQPYVYSNPAITVAGQFTRFAMQRLIGAT